MASVNVKSIIDLTSTGIFVYFCLFGNDLMSSIYIKSILFSAVFSLL